MLLNVLDILPGTSVDGPGLRTAVYLAGCGHACHGCHNPDSWNPAGGRPMEIDEIVAEVIDQGFPVTLTGGDPLFNPGGASALIAALHHAGIGNIWLYTGYTFEQILRRDDLRRAVSGADVIVDSPFIEALRDTGLTFRGSANQRIIRVAESLAAERPELWEPPWAGI